MVALIALACAVVQTLRGPLGTQISILTEQSHISCTSAATPERYVNFLASDGADPAVSSTFGRALNASQGGSCVCRYCDGVAMSEIHRQPRYVTGAGDASPCFSAFPVVESAAFGHCAWGGDDNLTPLAAMMDRCLQPDRDAPTLPTQTLFLVGDSHALSVAPGVALAVRGRYQLRKFFVHRYGVLPSCPKCVLRMRQEGYSEAQISAGEVFRLKVYNQMLQLLAERMLPGDALAMLHVTSYATELTMQPNLPRFDPPADFFAHTYALLEETLVANVLRPKGATLVLFGDWPAHRKPFTKRQLVGTRFKRDAEAQYVQPLAARWPSAVSYVDLWPFFCDDTVSPTNATEESHGCGRNVPGTAVEAYYDDHHLSLAGSIFLWPYLCDAIA